MRVSIIIPNYNGKHLLEKNLPNVFLAAEYYKEKTKESIEIIIIDDCSSDESVAFIKFKISNFKKIQLKFIQNEKNLGFAPTVNRGVKEAKGEIVVLLNSDVSPNKDFLLPLLKHFSREEVFAVGCMDKSLEHGKTVLRGRGVGRWQRGFLIHRAGELTKTTTLWVSGGSSAFKKSLWERFNGFNELYTPFYYEDIDLSYRALKSGYTVLFEPESIVTHEHEKGAIKSHYSSAQIKKIAYRNQILFVWLNADTAILLSHIVWLPYHIIKTLIRFDFPFIVGFCMALKNISKVIKKRNKNTKTFIKTDTTVIESI
jgi:GT2 family glycosyltransferase